MTQGQWPYIQIMTERTEAYETAARMAARAAVILKAAGFQADQSNQGDARYFTKPGSAAKIRIATYHHAHADQIALTFDRDRCLQGWYLTEAEIATEVADAIAKYEVLATDLAEEEEAADDPR